MLLKKHEVLSKNSFTGTPTARDLTIPGRELKGIYFALDMLAQQNRILDGETFPKEQLVNARGKRVLVIGGGDTGSDCIGTSIRQGATSVTQIEIMPQPPVGTAVRSALSNGRN